MNKLTIITKNSSTYFIQRLLQEAPVGFVNLINPWDTEVFMSVPHEIVLVRTTSIHNSSCDLDFLSNNRIHSIPSLHALMTLRTKPLQFTYFKKLGIPHLSWLDLEKVSQEMINEFSKGRGRLLIKPKRGQGGWGIRVFDQVSELLSWWESAEDREYMLQHYIEDHEEFRVFFMGDQYFCLKRIKNGVTANFKQDGKAELVPLVPSLKGIVDRIRLDLRLLYGAADFLVEGDKISILEMNLVPGIEQLERVTGLNIGKELHSLFISP